MVLSKTLHFADPALYDVSGEQKWIRGTANSEGYFTLQNPSSGKFLTASSPTSTTISGTYLLTFKPFICSEVRFASLLSGGFTTVVPRPTLSLQWHI